MTDILADAYYPFDAGAGANSAEAQWRNMWPVIANGVVYGQQNNLVPFADSSGIHFKVQSGQVWIRGHTGIWNITNTTSNMSAPAAGKQRIDRLVARADSSLNDVVLSVLTGAEVTSNPVEPALTQTDSIWEIPIARTIAMTSSTSTLASGDVIDERQWAGSWSQPWGIVNRIVDLAPQTSIGAEGDFTHPGTLSFLAIAGRRYRVRLVTHYIGITSPPGYVFAYICDSSNTHKASAQGTCRAASHDDVGPLIAEEIFEPVTTGIVTRHIRGSCTSGVYSLQASATQPIVFTAEDTGPAY